LLRLLTLVASAVVILWSLSSIESVRAGSPEESGLVAITWIAEEIDGQAVLERPQSTLTFPSEEQIAGISSCNRYFGSVRIDGNTLEFGNTGGTRMACEPMIDDQEQRFLDALSRARTFNLEDGVLILFDDAGESVLRFHSQDGQ